MDEEVNDPKEVTFKYDISDGIKSLCSVEANLKIPHFGSSDGVCERIFRDKKIPTQFHKEISHAFQHFVEEENEKYFDCISSDFLSAYAGGQYTFNKISDLWDSSSFKDKEHSKETLMDNDSELFSTVYHKLVHSQALETILQVENSYSLETQAIIQARDEDLAELSAKQTEEMCKAVEGLSLGLTEADITAIASRHLDEHGIQIASWQSKLAGLRDSQRSAYRDWLMSLLEQSYNTNVPLTPNMPSFHLGYNRNPEIQQIPIFQESFTIHLGSQMKQMYNIRIMAADVLDFCRPQLVPGGDLDPQPQRLQTSLGLYSSDLCGLVLLSDNHLGGFSGITKDFIKVCEISTELHFKSIEEQIEEIRDSVKEAIEWRKLKKIVDSNGLTSLEQQSRKSSTRYLQTGDVFITKHSNLPEVHVVYHIVVDDTVKSSEITSRHPVILGLRNILKSACSYDVTTLTLPVLLTHEINDEMTMAWYTKRAELVFKCIKGFMIEMATWGGSEIKNLQLLLPQDLSEEIFTSLANMLPCIFRLSNPLILKPSSSSK